MSTNLLAADSVPQSLSAETLDTSDDSRPVVSQLCCLAHGTHARITAVDARDAATRRLMEMGVLPGATVRVIKAAPLGCPLEIEIRGYRLAVRRAEAGRVSVVALTSK